MRSKMNKDHETVPTAPPPDETPDMDLPPPYQDCTAGNHLPPHIPPPNQPGYTLVQPYGAQYMHCPSPEGQFQPQVITMQPTGYVTVIKREPDYLWCSVFTMLCCCCPLGLCALVYSIKARDANHADDQHRAKKHSKCAGWLNSAAVAIGIIIYLLNVLTVVLYRRF